MCRRDLHVHLRSTRGLLFRLLKSRIKRTPKTFKLSKVYLTFCKIYKEFLYPDNVQKRILSEYWVKGRQLKIKGIQLPSQSLERGRYSILCYFLLRLFFQNTVMCGYNRRYLLCFSEVQGFQSRHCSNSKKVLAWEDFNSHLANKINCKCSLKLIK